jgi:type IV secretory pathway VirB4 component
MAVSSKATQDFVPIKEVRDGVVILKNGSMRAVVLASSLNFSLKSDDERAAITSQFQDFLNSLDFEVQISIESRRLDIRPYIALLEEQYKKQLNDLMKIQTREYIGFVKKFTEDTAIMTKSFFVVVPYDPAIVNVKGGIAGGLFQKQSSEQKVKEKEASFEENRSQLEERVSVVEQGLSRCDIRVARLGTEEVIELFYKIFNPGDTERPIVERSAADIGSR